MAPGATQPDLTDARRPSRIGRARRRVTDSMSLSYVMGRIGFAVAVVWVTATINFILPRVAPGDPISAMLGRMASTGVFTGNRDEFIAHYKAQMGLDSSLLSQYWAYLKSVFTLDFGYSISRFPQSVGSLIGAALPWTLGLVVISILVSFVLGTILGALLAWPPIGKAVRLLITPLMGLAAIPYYLVALLLSFGLSFGLSWFPAMGAMTPGTDLSWSWATIWDLFMHGFLPALSIVLTSVGFWIISMRGMMLSVTHSDALLLARAKGLSRSRLFVQYGYRQALLPQVTGLAIALGSVISGVVLVEVIFSYPGLGMLFYTAILGDDYPVIQGISLILAITLAASILILDLVYPLLDPRISYRSGTAE